METIYDRLRGILTSSLGKLTPTQSGFSKRNCPMCIRRGYWADTRQRFGIKMDNQTIGMNCFKCKFKVRWEYPEGLSNAFVEFLSVMGVDNREVRKIQFELFQCQKDAHHVSKFEVINPKKQITDKWIETSLPENSFTFAYWVNQSCDDPNFIKCVEYSLERGFYDENFYWTPDTRRQYNQRIIIPFYYKGKIVGFTGRLNREPGNPLIPKYLNEQPTNFIYNMDKQRPENKYLLINEGILDAYMTNGVAAIGSQLNSAQIDYINSLGKIVIAVPDRDDVGDDLIKIAVQQRWLVAFPPWGRNCKDAAKAAEKFGQIATVQSILEHTENRAFGIKIRRKMDKK